MGMDSQETSNESVGLDLIFQQKRAHQDSLGVLFRMITIYNNGTINSATMFMILIRGLIAGPAVSL